MKGNFCWRSTVSQWSYILFIFQSYYISSSRLMAQTLCTVNWIPNLREHSFFSPWTDSILDTEPCFRREMIISFSLLLSRGEQVLDGHRRLLVLAIHTTASNTKGNARSKLLWLYWAWWIQMAEVGNRSPFKTRRGVPHVIHLVTPKEERNGLAKERKKKNKPNFQLLAMSQKYLIRDESQPSSLFIPQNNPCLNEWLFICAACAVYSASRWSPFQPFPWFHLL